ncbi:23S rRNA (adenosine(1067)-2'-O)-methyltransferase [Planctomycetes bacterium Pan216]|uniref:23S rRNA (Adenosine(1067)-2'-O)-methyltransferase n=1 Tax=Kolteria novifilia TaxID=2527975 RepID=A0A518BBS2_9BACT|nr:23S rRNA (adenosine(1067)-2'-O)-methyltransferase [Planctomycetes bacterium Pan216]
MTNEDSSQLIPIASADDPRVGHFADLKGAARLRDQGLFIAEGSRLVDQLLSSSFEPHSLLVEERIARDYQGMVPPGTILYVATKDLIESLVGFRFHRGVLACAHRQASPPLSAVVAEPGRQTLVVCLGVQDPVNLGTIIRTSLALGADAILLGEGAPDPFSRRVLRASMGAVLKLPVATMERVEAGLEEVRRGDFELVATVVGPEAVPLDRFARPARMALLLGSEGTGLGEEWIAMADHRVTIPIAERCESLNVAIAAGIFLHHCRAK